MALGQIFIPRDKVDYANLHQGDILQKTESLKEVVRQAHPYYADAESYHFFMVLTQSCDLARRGKKGPNARYITIAAMRPLDVLLGSIIRRFTFSEVAALPLALCRKEGEIELRQYLQRLLNNTEHGYFFIRREAHPAMEMNYCVFLSLAIALRTEHYEACLRAKIAQLTDVFQAKVGWLTGHMFGRVGTPDLSDWVDDPKGYRRQFYEEVLYNRTVWLTAQQYAQFKECVEEEADMTEAEAQRIIDSLKDDIEVAAAEIAELLSRKNLLPGEDREMQKSKVANILRNSRVLKRLSSR